MTFDLDTLLRSVSTYLDEHPFQHAGLGVMIAVGIILLVLPRDVE